MQYNNIYKIKEKLPYDFYMFSILRTVARAIINMVSRNPHLHP